MAYKNPIPSFEESTDLSDFKSEYTSLEPVYFAFIDALGFKKTFDDIKISNKFDDIEKYKDVFGYYFEIMYSTRLMREGMEACYAGQTSDSLYFYTVRTDYLLDFIKIYSHFSLYAMSKNVFFRGGIAKGKLFRKRDYQFYGDCVIGAYLLESNVSKLPRILIDERTNTDLLMEDGYKNLIGDTENGRNVISPFSMINKPIDYLIEREVLREIDYDEIEKNIEANIKAYEFVPGLYEKYAYLRNEYSNAIGRIK